MDKQLKELLNQTLSIQSYDTVDKYNNKTYDAAVSEPCRIEKSNKLIVNSKGEQVTSNCQIYVDGDVIIATDSKIQLPDGATPRILAIQEEPDDNGNIYYKCIYT